MRYISFLLLCLFSFSACQNAEQSKLSADAKRFPIKGKVVSVDLIKKKAKIDHEKIPGYMDAMTMDFPIKDIDILKTMTPGAEVKAELVVDGDYWLEKIVLSAAPMPGQQIPAVSDAFANEGKEVPDFALTNQDSKRISFKDFRGKPLAITFIYSRCPLPEYCIAMSTRFSDMAKKIDGDPELKDKFRLLTISFDPATDTPETLKKYGLGYMGKDAKYDFKTWQLATGSDKEIKEVAVFFGLRYEIDEKNKTQFNHSLRTVVIAPDGKVRKVFSGDEWTIEELLTEMRGTLK